MTSMGPADRDAGQRGPGHRGLGDRDYGDRDYGERDYGDRSGAPATGRRGAHARGPANLRLVWVYPDLLSTYGDRGNLLVLERRARRWSTSRLPRSP